MLHILLKIGFTKITHAEAVFLNWDSLALCKVEQPHQPRHGVTRKIRTKRLRHAKNLFRKNLQLIGLC